MAPVTNIIEDFHEIAEARGGRCLSKKYLNSKTKLKFRCGGGHRWEAIPYDIKNGSWCRKCADKLKSKKYQKGTFEDFKKNVLEKGWTTTAISSDYKGISRTLPVKCENGHEFNTSLNSLKKNKYCQKCFTESGQTKEKIGIEELVRIAAEKGGRCLSQDYTIMNDPYEWECAEGHRWITSGASIYYNGSWCEVCSRVALSIKNRMPKKDMNENLKHLGIKCITLKEKYRGTRGRNRFKCKKGHEYYYSYDILKTLEKCPKCVKELKEVNRKEEKRQEVQAYIQEMGGTCKIVGQRVHVTCKEGHVFKPSIANLLQDKSWCAECSHTRNAIGRRKDFSEIQQTAIERGGKCLSKKDKYINGKNKLKWQCEDGHEWVATWNSIGRGSWCPYCHGSLGEERVRTAVEALMGAEFPKSYPKWLKSDKNAQLELDGYNERLSIAFEHHGEHHYSIKSRYGATTAQLNKRKTLDRLKRKLCKQNNVVLIEVPQVGEKIKLEDLATFITRELEKRELLPKVSNPKIDYTKAYYGKGKKYLKEAAKIAQKLGGTLVSEHWAGSEEKLEFRCSNKHSFKKTLALIRKGYFCNECNGTLPVTIEDLRRRAKKNGGEVLSTEYINNRVKYLWKCKEGHEFYTKYTAVQSGKWCKKCGLTESAKKQKDAAFLRIKEDAQHLGLRCTSRSYEGCKFKLNFRCHKNHSFKRTPAQIRSGMHCNRCKKEQG